MPCFIIGPDSHDRKTLLLVKLAEQLGYPTSVLPDLKALQGERNFTQAGRPLVLLPDTTGEGSLAEAAVQFAQAEHGHAFIVYIAETIAPDAYKRLVRTQAGEWITWQALPRELSELVRTLSSVEPSGRAAKILSFFPSKGGVGNTTLALETGVYLASIRKRSGSRVAILDLNLQGGTLADALDVEPRFDIREIMGQPERLDEQLIDIFTSRHSARLDVFASPLGRISPRELNPQVIFSVLDAIANRYDLILIDLPNHAFEWTDNIIQGSDAVVVCGGSTVPAIKQLGAKVTHLDEIAIQSDKVAVVVNQCQADLLGRVARRAEIDRTFAGRHLFYVRRDATALDEALNAGRPLMELAPSNRVSKDIQTLAQWAEGVTDRPQTTAPTKA